MSWNGFANPRNYNPGDWADAYEILLGFDGYVNPNYYDPGDWADGYEISGWDGYTELINYDGSTWADGYEISGWDGYAEPFVIEIGQVLGFWFPTDVDPPVLSNQNPAPYEIDVPVNTSIEFDITDVDVGLDVDSVIITIDGYEAWKFDAYQDGYDGYKTAIFGGFRYTINPPIDFSSYQTVIVRVEADDKETIPNHLDSTYSFRVEDIEAPILGGLKPDAYELSVPIESGVNLSIRDVGDGVDASSVELSVDGYLAWKLETAQEHFSVIPTELIDGYFYHITPLADFPEYTEIQMHVYAADFRGNLLDSYYYFQTMDLEPPFLINRDPTANQTEVFEDVAIQFDVYGTQTGADQYSIDAYVNGIIAMEHGLFVSPFDGPSSYVSPTTIDGYDGYHVSIDKNVSYKSESVVQIDVYALNMDGY